MSSLALALRTARGFYPERQTSGETGLDRFVTTALGHLGRMHRSRPSRFHDIVRHVDRAAERLQGLSEEELRWQVPGLRAELRARGFTRELVGQVFALVRELAESRLGERHFDVQLIGGWVLLNGMVAEMATGEGKTLAATLPACTAALAGIPVHVVTVNDYLAKRDAKWMGPVYEALGLRVGHVTHNVDPDDRRRAYRCDVTYCTNKELVFDYLRDRLELGRRPGQVRMRLERLYKRQARLDRLRLRGLCFAIVDEADSVLIDEARTPLIISGQGDNSYEAEVYRQALGLSEGLEAEEDYTIDFPKRDVRLTDKGRDRLKELALPLGGIWTARLHREELVRTALKARHLFHRDKHYVVKDGDVQIVDEYTGRILPGRSWEGGLHQLIETKEECNVTTRTEALARISYQRFFRRYLALAGMTGTAREAARELWSVYRLQTVSIPTHRPMIRRGLSNRIFVTADEKWSAAVARIAELNAKGRPVLVGTRTVADSERLSRLLSAEGLPHRVLNAKQDWEEARIIAEAGKMGRITVATNMAGRGTDIRISHEVRELGGLHVMATELHDARRIDRQLFGRCGRQGDPGSWEALVSLEDELLETYPARAFGLAGSEWINPGSAVGRRLGQVLFRTAQRKAERMHYRTRCDLLKLDQDVDASLAFSGAGE
jgi:preprotein translocase subunit SecA